MVTGKRASHSRGAFRQPERKSTYLRTDQQPQMSPLLRGESCTEPNVNFAQPRAGVGKNNTQAPRGHRPPVFTAAAESGGWGPPTSSAAVCGSSPSPCSPSLQQRTAQSTSPQHGVNRRRNPCSVQDSLDVPGGNECVPNEKGECTPKPREVLSSAPEFWGIASSAECGDRASVPNICPWPSFSKSLAGPATAGKRDDADFS